MVVLIVGKPLQTVERDLTFDLFLSDDYFSCLDDLL